MPDIPLSPNTNGLWDDLTHDPLTTPLIGIAMIVTSIQMQQPVAADRFEGYAVALVAGVIVGWRSGRARAAWVASLACCLAGTLAWLSLGHAPVLLNLLGATAAGLGLGLPGVAAARLAASRAASPSELPRTMSESVPDPKEPPEPPKRLKA